MQQDSSGNQQPDDHAGGAAPLLEDHRITRWNDFANVLFHTDGYQRIYRGISNAAHPLVPKIGRPGVFQFMEYSPEIERHMLQDFRHAGQPHLERGMSDFETLVIAQHHGLPTRLLDWSWNLLTATFFAVEPEGRDGDAAVYELIIKEAFAYGLGDPFRIDHTMVVNPPHISRRIAAQQGMFTVHHEPTKPFQNVNVRKHTIAKAFCGHLRQMLYNMGISRATLFPDLDGIADAIRWRYRDYTLSLPEEAQR